MVQTFYKYQGTGNDFILIDNRQDIFNKNNTNLVKFLCDRRFGIGADGLILLEEHTSLDFKMVYYNSDGNESTMCGNGGRCMVSFAQFLGIINNKAEFEAIDGHHRAIINDGLVKLEMQDVSTVNKQKDFVFLDTGSPHHIQLTNELDALNIKEQGSAIRYSDLYKEAGCNINFIQKKNDNTFAIRTYERGVEDETLSCGTGVTAAALAMHYIGETEKNHVKLETQGGSLEVSFKKTDNGFQDIWLIGPATQVFKGEIEW